jgi:hypothetical protein
MVVRDHKTRTARSLVRCPRCQLADDAGRELTTTAPRARRRAQHGQGDQMTHRGSGSNVSIPPRDLGPHLPRGHERKRSELRMERSQPLCARSETSWTLTGPMTAGQPGNAVVTPLACWFPFRGCLVIARTLSESMLLSTLLSTLPSMPALAADARSLL